MQQSATLTLAVLLLLAPAVFAQEEPEKPAQQPAPDHPTPQQALREVFERPAAVPARPTVTIPATLPPAGYLQFEQGINQAVSSPNAAGHVNSQFSIVQETKITLLPRLLIQAITQPYAHTTLLPSATSTTPTDDQGDVILGGQFLLSRAPRGNTPTVQSAGPEAPKPYPKINAIAIAYNRRVRTGTSPDLDQGSYSQGITLLLDGGFHGFTFQTNAIFNQQPGSGAGGRPVDRAQFGQTATVSHGFTALYSTTVELWHLTQPFVTASRSGFPVPRANAVGLLVSNIFTIRRNLILDAGVEQGLTSTSTRIQGVAGVTYLLPHRLWPLKAKPLH